ncbi:hypothetical protein PHYBOEH_009328 [Phytophthora boehmeriae]|uniref:Uncharacterized protein n=1 Tax=Phytophthora boehmeriae TaxID=109152 RepID=A0A8T1VUX0_9STRA|nr:hypothetical protein PHYBOEH_009328 [Phytophthora boehmeriae]
MSMDWEAPIPVWIDALNINDMHDLNKTHSYPSYPTDDAIFGERDSVCMMLDVDDITPVVESAAVNCAAFLATPTVSPVKSKATISPGENKTTAKPRRARTRAHTEADPIARSGRDQRRKDKQRGYEKNYRCRKKQSRDQEADEWIKLELVVRQILTNRTSVVGPTASASLLERYKQLLQEERTLREAEAFDSCLLAWTQALDLYGGVTAKNREIRAQMNALPSLPKCHIFNFTWS